VAHYHCHPHPRPLLRFLLEHNVNLIIAQANICQPLTKWAGWDFQPEMGAAGLAASFVADIFI